MHHFSHHILTDRLSCESRMTGKERAPVAQATLERSASRRLHASAHEVCVRRSLTRPGWAHQNTIAEILIEILIGKRTLFGQHRGKRGGGHDSFHEASSTFHSCPTKDSESITRGCFLLHNSLCRAKPRSASLAARTGWPSCCAAPGPAWRDYIAPGASPAAGAPTLVAGGHHCSDPPALTLGHQRCHQALPLGDPPAVWQLAACLPCLLLRHGVLTRTAGLPGWGLASLDLLQSPQALGPASLDP